MIQIAHIERITIFALWVFFPQKLCAAFKLVCSLTCRAVWNVVWLVSGTNFQTLLYQNANVGINYFLLLFSFCSLINGIDLKQTSRGKGNLSKESYTSVTTQALGTKRIMTWHTITVLIFLNDKSLAPTKVDFCYFIHDRHHGATLYTEMSLLRS